MILCKAETVGCLQERTAYVFSLKPQGVAEAELPFLFMHFRSTLAQVKICLPSLYKPLHPGLFSYSSEQNFCEELQYASERLIAGMVLFDLELKD